MHIRQKAQYESYLNDQDIFEITKCRNSGIKCPNQFLMFPIERAQDGCWLPVIFPYQTDCLSNSRFIEIIFDFYLNYLIVRHLFEYFFQKGKTLLIRFFPFVLDSTVRETNWHFVLKLRKVSKVGFSYLLSRL